MTLILFEADAVIENAECCSDESVYQTRKYIYGLGEGVVDMPPGSSLPLESNAEFLNGGKSCLFVSEMGLIYACHHVSDSMSITSTHKLHKLSDNSGKQ